MDINKKYLAVCLIVILAFSTGCIDNTKPQTGTILKRIPNNGSGELTIKNGLSHDSIVALATHDMPKVSVLSMFIRAYDSYTISNIPDNDYILYYTIGDGWNNDAGKFVTTKESSRFDDELKYVANSDYISIYIATLNPVPEGNATTENVNEEDFPR